MLHVQVDPHSGVPIYRQVMDQIKYYVASGALKVGDMLPSLRELAAALSVNPATVLRAYNELQHEGTVEMEHGKGVFVAAGASRLSTAQRREALRRLARQLVVEAAQMGAAPDMVLSLIQEETEAMNRERSGD